MCILCRCPGWFRDIYLPKFHSPTRCEFPLPSEGSLTYIKVPSAMSFSKVPTGRSAKNPSTDGNEARGSPTSDEESSASDSQRPRQARRATSSSSVDTARQALVTAHGLIRAQGQPSPDGSMVTPGSTATTPQTGPTASSSASSSAPPRQRRRKSGEG